MSTGIIYLAKNKYNQKCYVGQTIRPFEMRKREHLKNTIKNDYKFSRALRKYPEDTWEWSILAEVDASELDNLEVFFIQDLDSVKNGYNTHCGGNWSKKGNPNHTGTVYELWHPQHGEIRETLSELLKRSPAFRHIPQLVRKEKHQINEFVLLENKDNYHNIVKKYDFYHPDHGVINCTTKELYNNYRSYFTKMENRINVLTSGRVPIHFGWVLAENKDKYDDLIDTSAYVTLKHATHGTLTLKTSEFKSRYGLTDSGISFLKSGRNKSTRGWTLAEKEESKIEVLSNDQDFVNIQNEDSFIHRLSSNSFKSNCIAYIENENERTYLGNRFPLIKESYTKLGADRIKALSYSPEKLMNELKFKNVDIQDCIKSEVSRLITPTQIYTFNELKAIINDIYSRLNINKKGKATDLLQYCESKTKSLRYDGKIVKVVEILSV